MKRSNWLKEKSNKQPSQEPEDIRNSRIENAVKDSRSRDLQIGDIGTLGRLMSRDFAYTIGGQTQETQIWLRAEEGEETTVTLIDGEIVESSRRTFPVPGSSNYHLVSGSDNVGTFYTAPVTVAGSISTPPNGRVDLNGEVRINGRDLDDTFERVNRDMERVSQEMERMGREMEADMARMNAQLNRPGPPKKSLWQRFRNLL